MCNWKISLKYRTISFKIMILLHCSMVQIRNCNTHAHATRLSTVSGPGRHTVVLFNISPQDGTVTNTAHNNNLFWFSHSTHLKGKYLLNRISFKASQKFHETDIILSTGQFCNCEHDLRKSTQIKLSLKFNIRSVILCLKRPS